MRTVEESHGVPVEREVEGGRETTIARANDRDVHGDTVARVLPAPAESRSDDRHWRDARATPARAAEMPLASIRRSGAGSTSSATPH